MGRRGHLGQGPSRQPLAGGLRPAGAGSGQPLAQRHQGRGGDECHGGGRQDASGVGGLARPAGDLAAGDAAEQAAGAEEGEQAAGLPGVEQLRGEGPDLAQVEGDDDGDPEVEDERHPAGLEPVEPPEDEQPAGRRAAGEDGQPRRRQAVGEAAVEPDHRQGQQRHRQVDQRQPLGAEGVDKGRLAHRLGGVLEAETEEEGAEQRQHARRLPRVQLDAEAAQEAAGDAGAAATGRSGSGHERS